MEQTFARYTCETLLDPAYRRSSGNLERGGAPSIRETTNVRLSAPKRFEAANVTLDVTVSNHGDPASSPRGEGLRCSLCPKTSCYLVFGLRTL